ncbi:MAG: DUF5063 domain-containing protein [Flavisolibacter sp.]
MKEDLNISYPIANHFLDTVREFCIDIETSGWENPDAFIVAIHRTLVRLYNYGLELPLVDLTKNYADTLELEEVILDTALENIKSNTPFQYYWTILNPLEAEMPSNGTGDLIDDLFDIYKDLKFGMTYFDQIEGCREWGLWTLKMRFLHHWSDHCLSAISVIHEYLSNKNNLG